MWPNLQIPDWNWQKIKQKLSNTLTLNVCYLEIICFLDSVFYCINSGYWDKNNRAYSKVCTQNKCVCLNDRSNHWRCSGKKVFLEFSQNSQENNCTRVSVLIKLQASETFQTKFSWKLSNSEAELKKALKKSCN